MHLPYLLRLPPPTASATLITELSLIFPDIATSGGTIYFPGMVVIHLVIFQRFCLAEVQLFVFVFPVQLCLACFMSCFCTQYVWCGAWSPPRSLTTELTSLAVRSQGRRELGECWMSMSRKWFNVKNRHTQSTTVVIDSSISHTWLILNFANQENATNREKKRDIVAK